MEQKKLSLFWKFTIGIGILFFLYLMYKGWKYYQCTTKIHNPCNKKYFDPSNYRITLGPIAPTPSPINPDVAPQFVPDGVVNCSFWSGPTCE